MKKIQTVLSLAVVALIAFAGTALAVPLLAAQASDVPEPGVFELLRPVYDAVMHGQAALAAALALVALVALAKRYVAPRVAFLQTPAGTALFILAGAFGGAVATSLAATADLSWALLRNAGGIAAAAAGGWTLVKLLLIDPVLRPLANKAPGWLKPVFAIVFWFFDKSASDTAIKNAEAAGKKAVADAPAGGVDAIAGKPHDIP